MICSIGLHSVAAKLKHKKAVGHRDVFGRRILADHPSEEPSLTILQAVRGPRFKIDSLCAAGNNIYCWQINANSGQATTGFADITVRAALSICRVVVMFYERHMTITPEVGRPPFLASLHRVLFHVSVSRKANAIANADVSFP